MKYVVVDIGCIECGEPSTVLGIFTDKVQAEKIKQTYEIIQEQHWYGQHHFEIFEVCKENQVVNDNIYKQYIGSSNEKEKVQSN